MNIKKCKFNVERLMFLNKFRKNKNYCKLNYFNQFEKSTRFRKIWKFLSIIYQEFFENHSIFNEVNEKKSIFRVKQNML